MKMAWNVAVLGATGAVGEMMLSILAERKFPVDQIYALASSRSVGEVVNFGRESLEVLDAETFDWSQVQIAFFSAGAAVSAKYAPLAAEAGCVVIDNTSQFRYEADIPLVVPEVNPEDLAFYRERHIIANPNCSTIQMLVALKPIHDVAGIERINVVTFQSVSGTGKKAISELTHQTGEMLNGRPAEPTVYKQPIAFNVIPQIDVFQQNGYTKEEMKMVWETRKMLHNDSILVNATAVRVPVVYGHSEAIHIETTRKIYADEARELLKNAPGVVVVDDLDESAYPTALTHASGEDAVYVGRIREDISHPNGLNLWVVSDNIRKGAALNAVQIAEKLIADVF